MCGGGVGVKKEEEEEEGIERKEKNRSASVGFKNSSVGAFMPLRAFRVCPVILPDKDVR